MEAARGPGTGTEGEGAGPGARQGLPTAARAAAILFLVYGLAVIGGALLWGGEGWLSGAIRGAALVAIAGGLLGGARWAWILGLVFPGIWLLRGLIELGGAAADLLGEAPPPPAAPTFVLAGAVAVLAVGWSLLLTRGVRQAYLDRGRQ